MKGHFAPTTAAISTNTTTTIHTVDGVNFGPAGRVYIKYIGIDVTAAGTTSTVTIQGSGGTPVAVYATTAIGHQETFFDSQDPEFPGFPLPVGENLQAVTAGGAAATLRVSVRYEEK